MKHLEKHPIGVLAVGIIGTACSAIFVKYTDAPSLIIATYRLLWTVLLMTPLVLGSKAVKKELEETDKRTLLLCALSGIFLALHFTVWFESLKYTSVASSTAIVCTEVIWVAIGFRFFPGGKISGKAWLSIAITVIGSFVIAMGDLSESAGGLSGDLMALAAAIFAAFYTLIGRFARSSMTTTAYTYIVYLFCALSLCIAAFGSGLKLTGHGTSAVVVGLLLCVFSTLLGHTIFSWSLRFLSPAFVAASKLCQSPVAAVLALILFNEIPSFLIILGGLITLGGVAFYSIIESKEKGET